MVSWTVEKTYYYIEENGFQKKRKIIIRDRGANQLGNMCTICYTEINCERQWP
jgi:hypothetical protein